jgi:hypothetical protein
MIQFRIFWYFKKLYVNWSFLLELNHVSVHDSKPDTTSLNFPLIARSTAIARAPRHRTRKPNYWPIHCHVSKKKHNSRKRWWKLELFLLLLRKKIINIFTRTPSHQQRNFTKILINLTTDFMNNGSTNGNKINPNKERSVRKPAVSHAQLYQRKSLCN